MFEILINKIVSLLNSNSLIQEVHNYDVEQFNGDPVAVVSPSANENEYLTNSENLRIYAFTVRLFVKRTSPRTPHDADKILRELVTSVIDDFDKDYTFTGIQNPNGYTLINVFALPSAWGYSGREDEYRAAEITIKCRVVVDLNTIN